MGLSCLTRKELGLWGGDSTRPSQAALPLWPRGLAAWSPRWVLSAWEEADTCARARGPR